MIIEKLLGLLFKALGPEEKAFPSNRTTADLSDISDEERAAVRVLVLFFLLLVVLQKFIQQVW